MSKGIRVAAVAAFLIVATNGAAIAGTTGVISGYVRDEYGRPLPGATVELITLRAPFEPSEEIDARTHEMQLRTTSASGFYVFISLDPGFYQLRTKAPGMYFFCPPRVVVDADETSHVDLFLDEDSLLVNCGGGGYFGPA